MRSAVQRAQPPRAARRAERGLTASAASLTDGGHRPECQWSPLGSPCREAVPEQPLDQETQDTCRRGRHQIGGGSGGPGGAGPGPSVNGLGMSVLPQNPRALSESTSSSSAPSSETMRRDAQPRREWPQCCVSGAKQDETTGVPLSLCCQRAWGGACHARGKVSGMSSQLLHLDWAPGPPACPRGACVGIPRAYLPEARPRLHLQACIHLLCLSQLPQAGQPEQH